MDPRIIGYLWSASIIFPVGHAFGAHTNNFSQLFLGKTLVDPFLPDMITNGNRI